MCARKIITIFLWKFAIQTLILHVLFNFLLNTCISFRVADHHQIALGCFPIQKTYTFALPRGFEFQSYGVRLKQLQALEEAVNEKLQQLFSNLLNQTCGLESG